MSLIIMGLILVGQLVAQTISPPEHTGIILMIALVCHLINAIFIKRSLNKNERPVNVL